MSETELKINPESKIPMALINLIEGLVKNSLLITSAGMLSSALLESNPLKGIVYIAVLIFAIFGRIGILMLTSYSGPENTSEYCKGYLPGDLSYYDAGRNNIFSLAFTMWYIALPMFLEKNMNWYMLFALSVQLALACFVAYSKACVSNIVSFVIEILGGSLYGSAISVVMYYAGLRSWLMLSGIPTEEEAKKKSQSLKCVIKRGTPK
jgi:hypothetical protein